MAHRNIANAGVIHVCKSSAKQTVLYLHSRAKSSTMIHPVHYSDRSLRQLLQTYWDTFKNAPLVSLQSISAVKGPGCENELFISRRKVAFDYSS